MKILFAAAVGTVSALAAGVSMAQNANMINGGLWSDGWMGGYGGVWMPIVVAGFVAWIVDRGRK